MDMIRTVTVAGLIKSSKRIIKLRTSTNYVFEVHDALLCHFSRYYDAALNSGFAESSGVVEPINDFGSDILEWFVEWLYTYAVSLQEEERSYAVSLRAELRWKFSRIKIGWDDDTTCIPNVDQCVQLWVFADKYDVAGLRHFVAKSFVGYVQDVEDERIDVRDLFTVERVRVLIDRLPEDDKLLALAVEMFASHWDPKQRHQDIDPRPEYDQFPTFLRLVIEHIRDRQREHYQVGGGHPCACIHSASRLSSPTVVSDVEDSQWSNYEHECGWDGMWSEKKIVF